MPSPHPAVSPKSIAIALRYGPNVSRGIAGMEKTIDRLLDREVAQADEVMNLRETIEAQKKEITQMGAWIEERV
jgi:hypothetical protein